MGVEAKHAYRFGYLKSEKWNSVRLEALLREKGHCQICGYESIKNDAHHVWYPENIYDTEEKHLVILCRSCHEFIHSMIPECKTNNQEEGLAMWLKFKNAINEWRRSHMDLFSSTAGLELKNPKQLREILEIKNKEIERLNEKPPEAISKDAVLKRTNKIKAALDELIQSVSS